jgi:WD40 repeat protein
VEQRQQDFEAEHMEEGVKKEESQNSIHVFKGHSRQVTSLAPVHNKNTLFVSSGLDGKVRIWCVEKMLELYCFDIQVNSPITNSAVADSIQNVKLISDKIYAIIFKRFVEIGMINHLATSYFISN